MAASNVLETFYILFDTNADKTRQGLNQTEQDANRVESSLNAADHAGVLMGEHLVETFKTLATAALAFFSVEGVKELFSQTTELNAQLFVTSERLGVSVEDLDAWQRATKRAGGSAEGLTGTLDFLNRGLAGLNTPGGNSRLKPFLEELKIDPKSIHSAIELLEVLSDKSKALGAQQFSGIAERFGIDPGTQLLMANGRRALEDQITREKELGGVTQAQAENAHKFQQALDDLKNEFYDLGTAIVSDAYPALEYIFSGVSKFVSYLGDHITLVKDFFIGAAAAITVFYLPAIVEAAAATVVAIAPYVALAAVVIGIGTAFALVKDDIENFLDGNKSVIGTLSETWPVIGEIVREAVTDMGAAIKWFFDLLKGLVEFGAAAWNFLTASIETGLDKLTTKFPALAGVVKGAAELILLALRAVVDIVEHIVGLLAKLPALLHFEAGGLNKAAETVRKADPKNSPLKALPDELGDFTRKLLAAPGFGGAPAPLPVAGALPPQKVVQAVQGAQAALHAANSSPLTALAATGGSKRAGPTVNVKVDAINIQTPSTDPAEHGKIVAEHIENQVRQAIAHYDDGVQG